MLAGAAQQQQAGGSELLLSNGQLQLLGRLFGPIHHAAEVRGCSLPGPVAGQWLHAYLCLDVS